jgi:DNA-binding transcriptional ArsR family regulator
LLTALISRARWQILAEMVNGELFTVKGLAARIGDTPASVSKHLAILREAGITKFAIGGLHQITDQYRVEPEVRDLDFGYMVLRLPDSLA